MSVQAETQTRTQTTGAVSLERTGSGGKIGCLMTGIRSQRLWVYREAL